MFLGQDMSHVLPHERIRMGMSIKFQIPGVFPDLSVRQHLQLSLHRAKDDRPESLDELLRRFMLESEERRARAQPVARQEAVAGDRDGRVAATQTAVSR